LVEDYYLDYTDQYLGEYHHPLWEIPINQPVQESTGQLEVNWGISGVKPHHGFQPLKVLRNN
jgi:hypothetical protein